VYDLIGERYATGRRTDPRIAGPIWAALGGARSVLNVGAGSGSYEPPGRRVVAAEPSIVMLAQRPRGSAPAVRAVAERLPFPDGAFDAAMGVLTMHHWADRDRGLAEMRRVAGRIVLFLCDPRRRPRAILDPAVWGPMSALSLIPPADRAAGMSRLRADLDSGAWERRWGHLLRLAELDLGYSVAVTR